MAHRLSVVLIALLLGVSPFVMQDRQSFAQDGDDDGPDIYFISTDGEGALSVYITDYSTTRAVNEMLRVTDDRDFHAGIYDVDGSAIDIQHLTDRELRRLNADDGFLVEVGESPGYYPCLLYFLGAGSTLYQIQYCGEDMTQRQFARFAADVIEDEMDVDPPRGFEPEEPQVL